MLSDPGLFPYRGREFLGCSYNGNCVCVCVIRQSAASAVFTVARPLSGRLTDIALHFTNFSEEIMAKVGLSVRMTVFWHMRVCGSGDGYQRFENGRCLHIQDYFSSPSMMTVRQHYITYPSYSGSDHQDKQNSTSREGETNIH